MAEKPILFSTDRCFLSGEKSTTKCLAQSQLVDMLHMELVRAERALARAS